MKFLALTHSGMESVCTTEIFEKTKIKATPSNSVVIFETDEIKDVIKILYTSQSIIRLILLSEEHEFKNYEYIEKISKKTKASEFMKFMKEDSKLCVRCLRKGDHDVSSKDIESEFANNFVESLKKLSWKGSVNLNNPEILVLLILLDEKMYIGIDLAGRDLSKRDYKIYSHAQSLRGTVAFGLLMLSNYKPTDVLLDAFSGSATISIEAAHYKTGFPIHFYNKNFLCKNLIGFEKTDDIIEKIDSPLPKNDKKTIFAFDKELKCLKSGMRNAKIAGVEKHIEFSKVDVEWLDTKFDKNQVSLVVSQPPSTTARISEKTITKLYEEFFHQAEFILKSGGTVNLLTNDIAFAEEHAQKRDFKEFKTTTIITGSSVLSIFQCKK